VLLAVVRETNEFPLRWRAEHQEHAECALGKPSLVGGVVDGRVLLEVLWSPRMVSNVK
jgi:hypothetical protein